jgi:hypothetical protein
MHSLARRGALGPAPRSRLLSVLAARSDGTVSGTRRFGSGTGNESCGGTDARKKKHRNRAVNEMIWQDALTRLGTRFQAVLGI